MKNAKKRAVGAMAVLLLVAMLLQTVPLTAKATDEQPRNPPGETPEPTPEPAPEPTLEPTPLPEFTPMPDLPETTMPPETTPTPVPTPDPNDEINWPASPSAFDAYSSFSEERYRLIKAMLSVLPPEEEGEEEQNEDAAAQLPPDKACRAWFESTYPGFPMDTADDGWSGLFLTWAAYKAGLLQSQKFPVSLSVDEIEFFLQINGNPIHKIEEYRKDAVHRQWFREGELLFCPMRDSDGREYCKKAGVVTQVDNDHIEVVFGDINNSAILMTFTQEDIENGNALDNAEVIDFQYRTAADVCYSYFVNKVGLNEAAACGVLANVLAESGFSPLAAGDSGYSYGLFQWQGERKAVLLAYCSANGLDPELLDSQLSFFGWELCTIYVKTLAYLRRIDNSAQGAYSAADVFCRNFEVPMHPRWNGKQRGLTAQHTLWPMYFYRSE